MPTRRAASARWQFNSHCCWPREFPDPMVSRLCRGHARTRRRQSFRSGAAGPRAPQRRTRRGEDWMGRDGGRGVERIQRRCRRLAEAPERECRTPRITRNKARVRAPAPNSFASPMIFRSGRGRHSSRTFRPSAFSSTGLPDTAERGQGRNSAEPVPARSAGAPLLFFLLSDASRQTCKSVCRPEQRRERCLGSD